jgi:hypothetical protein
LTQAADQSEQPAVLNLREAAFSEGPAGVANAVKSLWRNIGAYTSSLVTYIFSPAGYTATTTSQGEPITGRDLIALLATIGVDFGLLVLALLNPPPAPSRRLSGQEERQIKEAIDTAIARAPGADMEWVRRHFINHRENSYLVIPNLASCDANNDEECRKALAMNQLAGVLDDLDVVEWPDPGWPKEGRFRGAVMKSALKKLRAEEDQLSDTDLTEIRAKWDKENVTTGRPKDGSPDTPLRNHGLFSKAERALSMAGWSEQARRDIEVFRLVDTEGLTPLLLVLNRGDTGGPAESTAGVPAAKPA